MTIMNLTSKCSAVLCYLKTDKKVRQYIQYGYHMIHTIFDARLLEVSRISFQYQSCITACARSNNTYNLSQTRMLNLHYELPEAHGYRPLDSHHNMRCGFL